MIDPHNHLQDPRLTPFLPEVIPAILKAGIKKCVVTGTSETDWPKVAALAAEHPDLIIPAFGLHPWKIADRSPNWLENLRKFLKSHPHALLGECGLDEWIKNPDRQAQAQVFADQINLALSLRRPLVIHCLQAWGSLFKLLEISPLPPHSLFHSYGGSAESAKRLAKFDPWFSFSGYFLDPHKKKARNAFKTLPANRILIETDAPDMTPPENVITHPLPNSLNHPANLHSIQDAFLQQIRPDLTATQLNENANCFLKIR